MSEKKKKKISSHLIVMVILSSVFAIMVVELVLFVYQYLIGSYEDNPFVVVLCALPSFALLVVSWLIYFNHFTLSVANTLQDGIKRISEGNYDVKIPYTRLGAFNAVYADFNKMAEELNGVRTLREDFVRDFSHELKTPIASINGFASLLLEGKLTEEENRQILKIIVDETERLSSLTESILLLSNVESRRLPGEKKPFRLDLQIKDCIILLAKQWDSKHIEILTDMEPVTYYGDASLLKHVWVNLLSNAVKFTPENGEITVSLKKSGERITAVVGDNGIGISEEELPKIFDKYYQGSSSGGGNGLGLAICKRVCELCGGSIEVASKKGEGTNFTVRL